MDIISITLVVVDFDQEEADPIFICVPALVIISYRTELVYPAEECYYYFQSFYYLVRLETDHTIVLCLSRDI